MIKLTDKLLMLNSFVNLLICRVIKSLRLIILTKKALKLLLIQITDSFWKLKVRRRVHVASGKTAEHCKEINLAYVSQGKKNIECEIATAKTHKLNRLGK